MGVYSPHCNRTCPQPSPISDAAARHTKTHVRVPTPSRSLSRHWWRVCVDLFIRADHLMCFCAKKDAILGYSVSFFSPGPKVRNSVHACFLQISRYSLCTTLLFTVGLNIAGPSGAWCWTDDQDWFNFAYAILWIGIGVIAASSTYILVLIKVCVHVIGVEHVQNS